ncbi:MAG TPA: hypothetical protein DEG17_09600 [Cyanobacteria bacterium UBA11149]|nr:hypothetical protein [Cyanobacteria bacterium UBA11367]HBE57127.1 hypothetical protein [Cyanobacteria bacterium UBA11366]HBK64415.1 hypothetical protein [Cyanobacteria bacterium UBA11166]HBR75768.1 hypothetical protein [Cyanobacteria bacterium UBA11159]HBS69814.1 hypothetical protein [Cyanobacteria bacterium UBA11153]HBW89102.1 hypothetical protein [Cyanobacteria bacterium UBA11149]HCA96972.1 hypothetical protein [Cyanobacteria bacterium UBA9226]
MAKVKVLGSLIDMWQKLNSNQDNMQPPQDEDIQDKSASLPPESIAENISAFADIYEEQIEEEGKERKLLLHLLQQDTEERRQLRLVLENLLKVMLQLQPSTLEREPEKPKQEQSSLESQIEKLQHELAKTNQEKVQLQSEINNLQTRLTSLEVDSRKFLPSSSQNITQPKTDTTPGGQYAKRTDIEASNLDTNIILNSEETNLVKLYEKQRNQLSGYTTEVSETEESIGERLSGNNQAAVLEQSRKGNYWIINGKEHKYLVPQKDNLKINTFNYETVEALFECRGYEANISSDFKLIKPGKVRLTSTGDKWQLIERGVLQF